MKISFHDRSIATCINASVRRRRTVDLLSNAIDWTRLGQWTGEGRRSFKQLAAYLVSHDADHLAQVRSLKEAQTVARLP